MRATCWIHRQGEPVPVEFLHEHHRQPRAFGGGDESENLIWLCSGCHDVLHRLARMLVSGKLGQVQDLSKLYLPDNPAARERLSELVKEASSSQVSWKKEEHSDDVTIRVTLEIPLGIHSQLKAKCKNFKKPNGKALGLADYIISVLNQHVSGANLESENSSAKEIAKTRPHRKKPPK